jgi:hypothetical protein
VAAKIRGGMIAPFIDELHAPQGMIPTSQDGHAGTIVVEFSANSPDSAIRLLQCRMFALEATVELLVPVGAIPGRH